MEIDKSKVEELITEMEGWGNLKDYASRLKALIDPKWEPKKYENSWSIQSNGEAVKFICSEGGAREFGNEWPTKELAETARDMNKRNQLILQAKTEMGYGDGEYIIYHDTDTKVWDCSYCRNSENPELTFENRDQAETVIKMVGLNE